MIVDIRPYHNQVTSYMLFTSNYLLFIFNLLAPSDFILNTHKTSYLSHLHQHLLYLPEMNGEDSLQLTYHIDKYIILINSNDVKCLPSGYL